MTAPSTSTGTLVREATPANLADVVELAMLTRDVAPELWSRSTELEASQLDSVVEHVLQARK